MEGTTTTAPQETATETAPVQAEINNNSSAPEQSGNTEQFDTSATIQAIKDWKAGKTNTEPEAPKPTDAPEAAPKQETPVADAPKADAFNPETYLTEATKGRYKNPEELSAAVEKLHSLETNPYAALPENEQQILQAIKQFENPQEYFAFQSKDFTAMDALSVLEEKFAKENADLDSDTLKEAFQAKIADKYPELEGYDETDIKYKLAQRELNKEAEAARSEFIKQQEEGKIKLPEPAYTEPSEEQIEKYDNYLKSVKSELESFNEMKIQAGEDGSEITIGIEGKEQIEQAMANPLAFVESRWINADGSYNLNQLKQDANILTNLKSFSQSLFLAGEESGKKGIIDEKLKNPTPLQPSVNPNNTGTIEESINAVRRAKQNQSNTF